MSGSLVGILLAIVGVIAVYFKGRKDANTNAEVVAQTKQTQAQAVENTRVIAEAEHETAVIESKSNVQSDVIRMPVGSAADRLRDRWSRD
jgi:hypothetical protein